MPSEFEVIADEVASHLVGSRRMSAAFLAWFLTNVWRLDPEEVEDSICDGGGDKGIDGIVVNHDLAEIAVFQSKYREKDKANTKQGDGDLKSFYGVAPYFKDAAGIDKLLASGPNEELRNLVARLELRKLLDESPYKVRLVFVTNAPPDVSALDYLKTLEGAEPPMELWDREPLASIALRTQHPGLLDHVVELDAVSTILTKSLDGATELGVALVQGTELVTKIPGIADFTVFDLNVRLSLGNTRINREMAKTISNSTEHAIFPAFHNGLTLLTSKLEVEGTKLKLTGISVVNGCQSLVTLHTNQARLTKDLAVLIKVVRVPPDSGIETLITYRANNQNPVNMRDQRSTHSFQVDLQTQVREAYSGKMFYAIREGEFADAPETLDNRLAAQLLFAVWLKEPWNAVRKVRLFDTDYHRIFGRYVDAHVLRLCHILNALVVARQDQLGPELRAAFASVRFTLAYLTAQVVSQTPLGQSLFDNPGRWLPAKEAELVEELGPFVDRVIDSVNVYVETRKEAATEEAPFDPKVVFKSATGVRELEHQVIQADKLLARQAERQGATAAFTLEP